MGKLSILLKSQRALIIIVKTKWLNYFLVSLINYLFCFIWYYWYSKQRSIEWNL